ncbi:MAG TPA: 2-dehydropantoate 2-reductase [Polyangiaceae bacterium]|nr:2-dehydropantoate 2-reductase [Polyangiaceae bacterium]
MAPAPGPGPRVGILGAGSIGAYLGARLLGAGVDTVLVGRAALGAAIREGGLRATDYAGGDLRLASGRVPYATDPAALADRDVVFVTVKSGSTAEAGAALAGALRPGVPVVSFQNGVRNAAALRAAAPGALVLAGMVPYNVLWRDGAHFHAGTSGALAVERAGEASRLAVGALRRAGLEAHEHDDVPGVLWGKLVLNLNNAVNALSGLTLREELSRRGYRRVLAALQREALAVLRRAGVRPRRSGPAPPALVPHVLGLPDALFFRVARGMITIDPLARSSMWDDFERGRPTEIDQLNGEIVALARSVGAPAPYNEAIVALVKAVEAGREARGWTPAALAARLGLRL